MLQKCICVLFSLSETDFYMDQFPSFSMVQYNVSVGALVESNPLMSDNQNNYKGGNIEKTDDS